MVQIQFVLTLLGRICVPVILGTLEMEDLVLTLMNATVPQLLAMPMQTVSITMARMPVSANLISLVMERSAEVSF